MSPSISKTIEKEEKNQNFHVTVIKFFVVWADSINFNIKQTSGYMPLININWHNNNLMTLGHLYQPSQRNISYKYVKVF